MPSFKRFAALFLLIFSVSGSVLPSLAWARGCAITCVSGSRTQVVNSTSMATDADCQKLCTGAPAQGTTPAVVSACNSLRPAGYTCRGPAVFTPDGTDPSSPVCSCTCVPAAGAQGSPVTVQTNDHCPTITVASPACVQSCAARCASPTAPVTAGMRPDPARQPSCVAPTGATTPTVPTPPVNQVDAPASASRDAVPLTLAQPIDGVTVVSDLGGYIALVYRYVIGLAGTAAVIMIVYGGFRYLLGSAMDDVAAGKTIIQDAVIGLLLVLGSYFILSTVNPNTLSLKLPNIQPITPKAVPVATQVAVTRTVFNLPQNAAVPLGGSLVQCATCTGEECRGRMAACPQGGRCLIAPTQTIQGVCPRFGQSCMYLASTPEAPSTGESICANPHAGNLRPCVIDSDCDGTPSNPAACLYFQHNQGVCTRGRVGDSCRCAGNGCRVATGGLLSRPTNNGATDAFPCVQGLTCIFRRELVSSRDSGGATVYRTNGSWHCEDIDALRQAAATTTPAVAPAPAPTPAAPAPAR